MTRYEAATIGALTGLFLCIALMLTPSRADGDPTFTSEPGVLDPLQLEELEFPDGCTMAWSIQGDQRAPMSVAWSRYVDARCNG